MENIRHVICFAQFSQPIKLGGSGWRKGRLSYRTCWVKILIKRWFFTSTKLVW